MRYIVDMSPFLIARSSSSEAPAVVAAQICGEFAQLGVQILFECVGILEFADSGYADFGTRPYLFTSAANICHQPPSSAGP